MTEVQNFENNKYFKEIKAKLQRKTTVDAKLRLINSVLDTKYFIQNPTAAQALVDLFNQDSDQTPINLFSLKENSTIASQNTLVNNRDQQKQEIIIEKREPLVMEKGKTVSSFGKDLENNKEYQRALDLYLDKKNINENCGQAWFVVKYYLNDQKDIVAKKIFKYLQKNIETIQSLVECGEFLGNEDHQLTRDIVLGWVQKKLKEKSIDTENCFYLVSGMDSLGGCNKEIHDLVFHWKTQLVVSKIKINIGDHLANLVSMIEIIYKRNVVPVQKPMKVS